MVKNDRFGNHVDIVDFHPSYHTIMGLSIDMEVHSFAWNNRGKPAAQVCDAMLVRDTYIDQP